MDSIRPPPFRLRVEAWFLILGASLALNAFLLFRLVHQPATQEGIGQAKRTFATDLRAPLPANHISGPEELELDWKAIAAADFSVYAANLHRIGCPEDTRREILDIEIRQFFFPLLGRDSLNSSSDFWSEAVRTKIRGKTTETPEEMERKKRSREIWGQYYELLNQYGKGRDQPRGRERFQAEDQDETIFLSPEKRERLATQKKDLMALRHELRSQGVREEEVNVQIRQLQAQQELERQEFLSLEELAEYRLRASPHANIANGLYGFEATPQERQALIHARERLGDSPSPALSQEQLRAALAPERWAAFQRAKDPHFQDMSKAVAHFELPPEAAERVYELKQNAEQTAKSVRSRLDLDDQARLAVLAELQVKTERAVFRQFGERAYEVYKKRAPWINALSATNGLAR